MPTKRRIGLGTAIKRVTGRLRIPHCAGCGRRAAALDRRFPDLIPDTTGLPAYFAEAARRWKAGRKR